MGCATSKVVHEDFSEEGDCHAEFKMIIVGDMGVGKTSTMMRFTTGAFPEQTTPSVAPEMKGRIIENSGKRVKLNVWDTVGQERFRTVSSSIYRHANGIVFMYDLCDRKTLTNIVENWNKEADRYAPENLIKILVGNKSDRAGDRQISLLDVQAVLKEAEQDWKVFELSASKSEQKDVDRPFLELAALIYEQEKQKAKD